MSTNDDYIFDEYEAKSGVIPGYFEPDFHEIENTAADLLESFSPPQIANSIRSFDSYLHLRSGDMRESPEDWMKGDPYGDYCAGAVYGCLTNWSNNGIDPSEAFGCSLKMHEAFAMAALAVIAMAFREEPKLERSGDVEELYWRLGRYAVEGTKLAYMAEVLSINPNLKVPVDQYRKTVASKGGQGKSLRYLPLKKAVHDLWHDQHQGRSNKEAARRIWQSLPPEANLDDAGKPILNPADPEATIAKWIGGFARGNKPGSS